MNLSRLFAPDDGRDALRTLAGLLLGLGFFMAWARKSGGIGGGWGDWGLFVTLLIITVFLYGVGLTGRFSTPTMRAWQSVYMVFGILLIPFLLLQFIEAVNGNSGAALNIFWVFLVAAVAAFAATLIADVRYGLLLGSIFLIVSWSALWHKILSNGLFAHYGIFRGLLVIIGLLLLAGAVAVYRTDPLARLRAGRMATPEPERWLRAQDMVTGAAIAGVGAGALTFSAFFAQSGSLFAPPVAGPSLLWDLVLLVASLLAVLWGASFAVRGSTYIGAIGLVIFVIDVGSEIGIDVRASTIVGWPLILALVGAGLFLVSLAPNVTSPNLRARIREIVGGQRPSEAAATMPAGTAGFGDTSGTST
ncbi:MAG TPA: hypothetical protein VE662_03210 [Solirubrobacterales bacterium]|nr:hypothetical protein [Solirubrobacterales bacterium]